jgi:hypothetical protein
MQQREHRLRVDREVTILFDGRGEIRCKMRNSSHGGAMLVLPHSEWLPPSFELREGDGSTRRVAVAWQGSDCAGVRYLDDRPQRRAAAFGRRGRL